MTDDDERLRRWRLVLGKDAADSLSAGGLSGVDAGMDSVLEALYGADRRDAGSKRHPVGLGPSCPNVNRWLGDIRTYFPSAVVRVMQRDAMERLNLRQMLLEPESLAAVEADPRLVATLVSLKSVIPQRTKETARQVVRKVVDDLERRLRNRLTEAVRGALNKATRTRRPRAGEIDWDRTIRANLKHYLPDRKTLVAERLVGYGRRRSSLRDVVLCVDQSGSMATSVVYASVFGAVLASLRAVGTKMVVYDTEVADLTEKLADPVDLLFGAQLGGGNDTPRALDYCRGLIRRPAETILVLISDLYEGHLSEAMIARLARFASAGVTVVVLLALNDDGAPSYDHNNAAAIAGLGIPVFACTPDLFPDLMASAIRRRDLSAWAAKNDLVVRGRGAG